MSNLHRERKATATTPNEFIMLMNVLEFMKKNKIKTHLKKPLEPRKLLAIVTGVSVKVAQKAIYYYLHPKVSIEHEPLGRPKKFLDPEYNSAVRTIVLGNNAKGVPNSTKRILKELLEEHHFEVSLYTLQRDLLRMGFVYIKGDQRNILYDSNANVIYRHWYIEQRLLNLSANECPFQPEVFLDESYCHLDHHAQKTWTITGGHVNVRGRKPMLVIFGAFIVFSQNNKCNAELVNQSINIWQPKGKKIDVNDYHGNFTEDIFEEIFEKLCKQLRDTYKTGCIIHMDGAKYHLRRLNPVPTSANKVLEILKWFQDNNFPLPLSRDPNRAHPTKVELLTRVREFNIHPIYASYEIARRYGHTVLKTPPYHCELQPIERVWSMVKEPIAHDPRLDETAESLKARLMSNFNNINEHSLISVWKKTVHIAKQYVEADERETEDHTSEIALNVNVIETEEEVEDLEEVEEVEEVDSDGD